MCYYYNAFNVKTHYIWEFSSVGRAPALQADGHRFESYNSHHFMREWLSGRALPCQGKCREFESRLPLQQTTFSSLFLFSIQNIAYLSYGYACFFIINFICG